MKFLILDDNSVINVYEFDPFGGYTFAAPLVVGVDNVVRLGRDSRYFDLYNGQLSCGPLVTSIAADFVTLSNAINSVNTAVDNVSANRTMKFVGFAVFDTDVSAGSVSVIASSNMSVVGYGTSAPTTFLIRGFGTIAVNKRCPIAFSWANDGIIIGTSTSDTQFQIVCTGSSRYTLMIFAKN